MKTEEIVIDSKNKITNIFRLGDLFKYKDLFRELVLKDIKMRHKQTILGVLWVLFQPLLSTIIFTFIFGVIIKVPSNGLPYPLFVFIGLNYWNLFSSGLTSASGSLSGNESLIKKVYFPRVIVPLASIATNFFDFLISTVFLLLLSLYYNIIPGLLTLVYLPILILMLLTTITGLGFFLSALNVRYRDVRQILPFFIQILIFLTPVFYPTTLVSNEKQWLLAINPLTTVIEITRNLFMNSYNLNVINLCISSVVAVIIYVSGISYFKKTERYFADLI